MTSVTIPLSREAAERLAELAQREGVSTEKLATAGLEDWLTRQRADFIEAARYVLKKNEELYRRLA